MVQRRRRSHLSLGLLLAGAVGVISPLALGDIPPPPDESRPLAAEGKTFVVAIDGEIELGLASYVERVIREADTGDLLVFHINTFGGRIDAAVAIRDAILKAKAKTVAFVDKRAISAGALIALSTDTIVMASGATIGAATPVEIKGGEMAPVEAKVVSYFRKEMKATAEAKRRRGDIAEAMVDSSVVVDGLDGKDTTLTLTTAEAIRYRIAAFSVDTLPELGRRLGRNLEAGSPATLRPGINWAERIARVLSSPAISSLLMTLGMLGILIELWSPGHAVAGALGVMCLLMFFFGHYVVNLAGWEEMILFVVGVAAVGFEVFFWPGHGMLAVGGVVMIVASLVMALLNVKHVPIDVHWALGSIPRALEMVFGSILATGVLMAIALRFLPRSPLGKTLILSQTITGNAGSAVAEVGVAGTTQTPLRPAGKALFDGKRVDVVSEGGFIDQGRAVVVVAVDGSRVTVRGQA